eukprot:m.287944 g.287944  ORF g.287944 m.287944 type:complete len:200 (+) comp40706_c0_seq11:506-1105(+)
MADPNAKLYLKLRDAVIGDKDDDVEKLLKGGALGGIKDVDKFQEARMHMLLARKGRVKLVKTFYLYGLDVKQARPGGWTMLHEASEYGHTQLADFLLNNEYSLIRSYPLKTRSTPLHIAVEENRFQTARLLARKGADVTAKDQHGESPLDHAKRLFGNDSQLYGFLGKCPVPLGSYNPSSRSRTKRKKTAVGSNFFLMF